MIADTNIFLRYFLNDIEELSNKAAFYLENFDIVLLEEVFTEIIYVLEKNYKIPRITISKILERLLEFENIQNSNKNLLIKALEVYQNSKFDIVDCILISYNLTNNISIVSFDKNLINRITQK